MQSWQGYKDLFGLPVEEMGQSISKQLMEKQHSSHRFVTSIWAPLAPCVSMEPTGEDRGGSDGEGAAASAEQRLSPKP